MLACELFCHVPPDAILSITVDRLGDFQRLRTSQTKVTAIAAPDRLHTLDNGSSFVTIAPRKTNPVRNTKATSAPIQEIR